MRVGRAGIFVIVFALLAQHRLFTLFGMTVDETRKKYLTLLMQRRFIETKLAKEKREPTLPGFENHKGEVIRRTYGRLKGVERALGNVIAGAARDHIALFVGSGLQIMEGKHH
jgi:CobQ-like glutamine amidotransferase family enzyme